MTTEPTYDPEALKDYALGDMSLAVAKLDAALWIFHQWQNRSTKQDDQDFIDGMPENEVLYAIENLVADARDDIKEILAKYAAKGGAQ